jgi:hypothetical protein
MSYGKCLKNYLFVLYFSVAGCTSNDDSVFKSGVSEQKPTSSVPVSSSGLTENIKEVGTFKFALKISSNSGATVCKGDITARIMSNFTMEYPEGVARCASIQVDLAKMLGQFSGNLGKIGKLTASKGVLYIASIAGAEFSPPRPILLGPIIRNPEIYKDLDITTNHTVTIKDASGQTETKDGSFNVKVHEINKTEEVKNHGTYDSVIHWQITRSGFEGISPLNGLILDSLEWWFNIKPISIPRLKVKANIQDFVKSDDPSLASVFGNVVTLELVLIE